MAEGITQRGMGRIDAAAIQQLFADARSQNGWLPDPVSDDQLREAYEIAKWGPTSMNTQPMRLRLASRQWGSRGRCWDPLDGRWRTLSPVFIMAAFAFAGMGQYRFARIAIDLMIPHVVSLEDINKGLLTDARGREHSLGRGLLSCI